MAFQASPQLTLNLYSAEQVRELDRYTIEDFGIPGIVLMKRAGQAILNALLERKSGTKKALSHITIFCGAGNNGGDGYIVAGLAKQKNIGVSLIETAAQKLTGDAALARAFALAQKVEPIDASEWLKAPDFSDSTLIVDALLGTGFNGALRQPYADLITQINQSSLPIIAADLPSGLSADTGAVSEQAVEAHITVTFIGIKIGLFTGQGRAYAGDIVFDDLAVPADVYKKVQPLATMLDYEAVIDRLPQRKLTNHKGNHGHVVIVGGDLGFAGAPLMAAEAAARVGTGLVSVITRPQHQAAIIARHPEIMVCDATDTDAVQKRLAKATAIVVGPGLNTGAWGQKLLHFVLAAEKPMLLDADALNLFAARQFSNWLPLNNAVITPHPGEAARLLDVPTENINQDRISAVKNLQAKFAAVALLKGSGSLIANGIELSLCPYGNPGMGSGGMGDLLAGIMGGPNGSGYGIGQSSTAWCLRSCSGCRYSC